MKFNSKLVALAVCLMLSVAAFAGDTHKADLNMLSPVVVNGTSLPAGEYKLQWEGNGPNLQLSILKGKKVVATTDAHMVQLAQKPASNAAVTSANADGTRSLKEVRFAGKPIGIALGNTDQAQMKGNDASK